MVAMQSSMRPRAGRPRRLSPLPQKLGLAVEGRPMGGAQERRPSPEPGLAQSIQLRDLLRAPQESDALASRRLAAFMHLCEDQHRAFGGSGGVARYQPSQVAMTAVPNDEQHLRKVKALARYTRCLRALPSEAAALLERLVALPSQAIIQAMQQDKARVCWALDHLIRHQQASGQSASGAHAKGGRHGR
jgi:hypothetical protein